MTEDYTKEIRERLEKATPGPWEIKFHNAQNVFRLCNSMSANDFMRTFASNRELIESIPTDIANLLEEREVLREALKKYASMGTDDPLDPYRIKYAQEVVPHGSESMGWAARKALSWKPKD